MKKIGFIGIYDKTDLLINIAKILVTMSKKVLIVDSTINQKARYVVPAIHPTISYVTTFEEIDVAVGFNTLEDIKDYIGVPGELPYDIILIDIDLPKKIIGFELDTALKNYFVTSFDLFSLKRGLAVFTGLQVALKLTKVLYSKVMLKEENDYLNFLSSKYKIVWDDNKIYFPLENGDNSVLIENQRMEKIKLKRLSVEYKDNLAFMVQEILEEKNDSAIRKAIKLIERGA